ncbi:GNAT family N-acetyltransferase [candidate division KSB1 bacterium]|nr:GNAT family N-acetyltransferase [candidate division KSB1 bacterium]
MNILDQNLPIEMILNTLTAIPDYDLSENFYFQWYQSGDEKIWLDIHDLAEKFIPNMNLKLYHEQFDHPELLNQRQVFMLGRNQQAIGTSTAWYKDDYDGQSIGRVHWVAIIPEFQGKGLAKPLMSLTLKRLAELGHTRAYLSTSSGRVAAIKLYLKFGFKPVIKQENDHYIWKKLEKVLGTPIFLR